MFLNTDNLRLKIPSFTELLLIVKVQDLARTRSISIKLFKKTLSILDYFQNKILMSFLYSEFLIKYKMQNF